MSSTGGKNKGHWQQYHNPCGENGQFHMLVLNCLLFNYPLNVATANPACHNNYWFISLLLQQQE